MLNPISFIKENIPSNGRSSRIFHGRGKKFPGYEHICIDLFASSALITLYKETSQELVDDCLAELNFMDNILLQKRYLKRPELVVLKGSVPTSEFAVEGSLKFNLKFGETQNIGFFLDMYPGRELLKQISAGKKVLNLFSYTCSLSVAAIDGGAAEVINVDMSKAALLIGEQNHHLNGMTQKARFMAYDIMNSWKKIQKPGPYDVIVIDPPSNQGESFKVERDYYKIIKRLNEMTNTEATIVACLNSPYLTSDFLIDLFSIHAPEFKFQNILYSAFSAMENNPEEGLKIAVFKKETHE